MIQTIPLLDLVFLLIERPDAPANVGLVMLFEPPAGKSARSAVLAAVRAYRTARPDAPFDRIPALPVLGLPHWRRAPDANMRHHVRHETLPAPGRMEQLWERIAAIHGRPMDRGQPLFAVHFIDGLEDGRFALYLKSHHATWDGRSALARVLGSLNENPGEVLPPFYAAQPWLSGQPGASGADAARALPNAAKLLHEALALRELVDSLVAKAAHPDETEPAAGQANAPFAGPHTRFNRRLSGTRSVAGFSLPMAQLRQAAKAFDGTVNDAVLTVVDAGLRRYLAERGERPGAAFVAMCPISQRAPGDYEPTVKVATLFVKLGEPRASLARRMESIIANSRAAKRELRAFSKEAARDYAALAFGAWWAARLLGLDAVARPVVNFVVSNIGGESGPRYLGRSRLVGAFPMSMVSDPTALNISLLSSGGRVDFGIVADGQAVPHADAIARHCAAAFEQLRRAGRRRLSA